MKRKVLRFLGVGLVLALVFSLVPLAGQVGAVTSSGAGYQFGTGGTVTWDTGVTDNGSYSVKLNEDETSLTYVEFIPAPGTTMSDLDAGVIAQWRFRYRMASGTSGGPNIELRFTSPTFDASTGAEGNAFWGHADVNTQATGFTAGVWTTEDSVASLQVQTYFNDPVDGTAGNFASSPFKLLSETLAAIDADSVMTDHGSSAADWELTRVRIELANSTNRICYIDDVIIDGVTYVLEPFVVDAAWYKTGDTVNVTVYNGNDSGTTSVFVKSTTVGAGGKITVALSETGTGTGIFTGTFDLVGTSPGTGELLVDDADTIDVTPVGDWGDGAQAEAYTSPATVDDTVPTITISTPAAGANITDATPELKATYTDADSTIADNTTTVMTLDGSAVAFTATTTQVTYTPSANISDGSHSVTVDVSDAVGNAATQASWSFTVDTTDPVVSGQVATPSTVKPNIANTIVFTATASDATSGVNTVTIDLSDSAIGGSSTKAMLDDGNAPDATASDGIYTANFTGTIATEATYTLTVTATDYVGNTGTADIELVVAEDNTPPVIASPAIAYLYGLSSAPPGGVGGTVIVSANVTEAVGMGTVTAASSGFSTTVTLEDDGNAPDATAGDDIYTATATVATGTSGVYTVTITAVDAKTNAATPDTSLTLTVAPVTGWDITLVEGWNLISVPLIPTDDSITVILADISDNVTQVRTWVYVSGVLTEKVWVNDGPAGFTEMGAGQGYWIEMTDGNTLTVTGVVLPAAPQAPPSYAVYEGWNLVGFKALTADTAADYLGTAVTATFEAMYGYDAAGDVYTVIATSTSLAQGQGYWLAVSADGTIYP